MSNMTSTFCSVYGPVKSWRFGDSLGIDPIGLVSTCSFNCVYCQLGEIENLTAERQVFVPTTKIISDLQTFAPWNVDVVTLSGSGEPTLALNLGEIITVAKRIIHKKIVVLTNSSLLHNSQVRGDLKLADLVAAKLDAISLEQLRRVNRPVNGIDMSDILTGIKQFRQEYDGYLAIQTMMLSSWSEDVRQNYIKTIESLQPDEIQLNLPTRPRPLSHYLDSRGNHSSITSEEFKYLRTINPAIIYNFATEIEQKTGISVRYRPTNH